jgi:hypothetical protein
MNDVHTQVHILLNNTPHAVRKVNNTLIATQMLRRATGQAQQQTCMLRLQVLGDYRMEQPVVTKSYLAKTLYNHQAQGLTVDRILLVLLPLRRMGA